MKLSPKRKGKIGELIIIKKLTESGFDVYDNIVDDKGIDLIVRNESKRKIAHKDVQVKYSKLYEKGNLYWFGISKSTFKQSKKLYILFVLDENRIFVFPSFVLAKILKNVYADKKGNWKVVIKQEDNWVIRSKTKVKNIIIDTYLNNFKLLR